MGQVLKSARQAKIPTVEGIRAVQKCGDDAVREFSGKFDQCEEMLDEADRLACEHVEMLREEPRWVLEKMQNYDALLLGLERNVACVDEVIGTDHTLPAMGASRYMGGRWAGKFLKTCSYQQVTPEASAMIARGGSRLCKIEGFWGHKEQADLRVRRYGAEPVAAKGR